jgi:integrase
MDQIGKQHIKDLILAKQKEGFSKNTLRFIKSHVSSILEYAAGDDEIIPVSPAKSLGKRTQELLRDKGDDEKVDPLTKKEVSQLLATVQEHFPEHYALFLLLVRTGLRMGEAFGLRWEDIDWTGRTIVVERQFTKGRLDTPKNHKSRRVDMSQQLTDTLRTRLQESLSEYLFPHKVDRLINLDAWRRLVFHKVLEKAGLKRITPHDLRHTYATLRISAGHDIVDVSNQLGHPDVSFTLRVYHHWKPGTRKGEVDSLDDFPETPICTPVAPRRPGEEKELIQSQLTH